MSVPAPALFAIIVLLGWPAAQIAAILIWGQSLSKIAREYAVRFWDGDGTNSSDPPNGMSVSGSHNRVHARNEILARTSVRADDPLRSDHTEQRPRSRAGIAFLEDMAGFMIARKKFWLIPALVLMTIFGGLIVLTKGSLVAPFIYTMF